MTTYALFQLRRGLSSLWKTKDTILSEGEMGFETDTGQIRIGDGSSGWTKLPVFVPAKHSSNKLIVSPDLSVEEAVKYYNSNALIVLEPSPVDEQEIILPDAELGTVIRFFNNGILGGNSYVIHCRTDVNICRLYPQQACSLIRRNTDWIAVPSVINAIDFLL
jgi:hypothetical protein